MKFIDKFLCKLFSSYSVIDAKENDQTFSCNLICLENSSIDEPSVISEYTFLQNSDQFVLTITVDESDPIVFNSNTDNIPEFIVKLKEELNDNNFTEIKANINIHKSNIDGKITIYDLDIFSKTLEKLTISEAFVVFTRAFNSFGVINFLVFDLANLFGSQNINFISHTNSTVSIKNDRQLILEKIKTVSYYENISSHSLIPDDFKLEIESPNKTLNFLFDQFSKTLSVIYLFDITSLKNNILNYKINGYISISSKTDVIKDFANSSQEYFNIYKWVYSGGNLNDKIGLARNILSLHFKKTGELELQGNSFQSIQSSYKVYEKQNIKQYIEIRNKISDQLLDFNNRANKLIETFASGFQKSALALITFYISAIAIKVLGKGDFIQIFTIEATLLSIAFIITSYIYYKAARWEVIEQRKRFVESYANLKERYTDLLDKEDINRIVNNDKEFNSDLKFIDDKLNTYSNLWKYFLLTLLITTLILFGIYCLTTFLQTNFAHVVFGNSCNC